LVVLESRFTSIDTIFSNKLIHDFHLDFDLMLLRLTIVRKIDAGDGSYPSVNTCVHYLKVNILKRFAFNKKYGQIE